MEAQQKKESATLHYLIFSTLEFIYRMTTAFPGYLTVFLQGRGMSASVVGMVGAITSAIGIIAGPFWGMISDKMRSVRKVFLIVMILSAITWGIVPSTLDIKLPLFGLTLGFLFIGINAFFRLPCNALMDSWMIQSIDRHRLVYGSVRIWGSIGFALTGFILSPLLASSVLTVDNTFHLTAIVSFILLIFCLFLFRFVLKDDAVASRAIPLKEMHLGGLFGNFYFVTFMIFSIFRQMPVTTLGTFLPYLMEDAHISNDLYGLISGYRALLEVPVLLSIVKLRKRFSLPQLMIFATCLNVVECLCYFFINGFWPLMVLQTLHGLSNGVFVACNVIYVFQLAPDHLKATAQTVAGSVNAMSGIIGNLLGGFLLDIIGVRNFYVSAGLMVFVALLFFLSSFAIGKKVSDVPSPLINRN